MTFNCKKILAFPFSKELPRLEGKQNVTILDTQILKLRLKSLHQIQEAAIRLRNEAMDVKATLSDIEDWLDRLIQLTEEVNGLYAFGGGGGCTYTHTYLLGHPWTKNNMCIMIP